LANYGLSLVTDSWTCGGLDKPAPLCTEPLTSLVICHDYGNQYQLEELEIESAAGSVQKLDESCFRFTPTLTAEGYKEIAAMICDEDGLCEMVLFEVKVGNCNETAALLTQGENSATFEIGELPTRPNVVLNNAERRENFGVQSAFTLYPNPTKDKAVLRISEQTDYEKNIAVYDMRGMLIQQIKLPAYSNESTVVIDLSEIPTGIYMIRLKTPFDSEVQRLVKE